LMKVKATKSLKEVIFLAITDFMMFPEQDNCISRHIILDDKSLQRQLKDFSYTLIELPKSNDFFRSPK
jgi:hypothetical protein